MDELGRYLSSANSRAQIVGDLGDHVYLALLPLVLGIVLAIAAGRLGHRRRAARQVLTVLANCSTRSRRSRCSSSSPA